MPIPVSQSKNREEIRTEEEDLRVRARAKYSSDMYALAEDILGYEDMYEPLHRKVCEFLNDWKPGKYIKLVLIPRGHLKSTLGSITSPIYEWIQNPASRVLMCHGVLKIGLGYAREMKAKIQSPMLPWMFPEVFYEDPAKEAEVWHIDKFTLKANTSKVPSFMVTSEDTSTTGYHYHRIICDDIVHADNVQTVDKRQKTKQFFHDLIPQLLPGGKMLILGTRYSNDDLYGYLMDPENEFHECIDTLIMDCGYPGEPVFPRTGKKKIGFTTEDLHNRKKGMDPYTWSCQYMNDPTPQETQYFPRSSIKMFDFIPGTQTPPCNTTIQYYTAVDPNRSLKTRHDPAVVMTCGIDAYGHYWVTDITRGHPSGPELVDWIYNHAKTWNSRVLVEAIGYQNQICEWLKQDMVRRSFFYSVTPVERGPAQKIERITKMQPMVAQGRLHVRRGFDQFLQELEFYPDWKNDDMCDTMADIYALGKVPLVEQSASPKNPYLINAMMDDAFSRKGVQRVWTPGVRRTLL